MTTYSIDTNAILRFLLSDISFQANAVEKLFIEARKGIRQVKLEEAVFIEAVYVLMTMYKFPKSVIVEKLKGITNLAFIEIPQRAIILGALTLFEQISISFVDALLLSHAKEDSVTVFTFDKKLSREAKRLGLA